MKHGSIPEAGRYSLYSFPLYQGDRSVLDLFEEENLNDDCTDTNQYPHVRD